MNVILRALIVSVCFVVASWAAVGGNALPFRGENGASIATNEFVLIPLGSSTFTFRIQNTDGTATLSVTGIAFDQVVNCAPTLSSGPSTAPPGTPPPSTAPG